MKPLIIIIEDQIELANEFENLLDFGDEVEIKKIVFTTKSGPIHLRLGDNKKRKRGFLIDLNLNPLQKEERGGLALIRQIDKRYPDSFIIAYSSYGDKNESLDAGANFFFLKRSKYNSRDFIIFKQFFLNHFNGGDIKSSVVSPISEQQLKDSIKSVSPDHSEELKEIATEMEDKFQECKFLKERKKSNLNRIQEIKDLGSDKNGKRLSKINYLQKEIETCEKNIETIDEDLLKLHTLLKALL